MVMMSDKGGVPGCIEPRASLCWQLPRTPTSKLSEKGYRQHPDREFGWYTDGEIVRKTPHWCPTMLRCRPLRGFSDMFYGYFGEAAV
jgi:hypothetical protein